MGGGGTVRLVNGRESVAGDKKMVNKMESGRLGEGRTERGRKRVSNLVFYAQSIITVISGREGERKRDRGRHRERQRETAETQRQRQTETERQREKIK